MTRRIDVMLDVDLRSYIAAPLVCMQQGVSVGTEEKRPIRDYVRS